MKGYQKHERISSSEHEFIHLWEEGVQKKLSLDCMMAESAAAVELM